MTRDSELTQDSRAIAISLLKLESELNAQQFNDVLALIDDIYAVLEDKYYEGWSVGYDLGFEDGFADIWGDKNAKV